ncbi:hypothetical protein SORDD17_00575 [Streptococcus oralis]|uniref:Uncharacterized protein n=1 Tax=Streptococcus oralis TaxID=1303 RepID=A0A139RN89_STROR|nr:hypothetical protein SORDD17_00575 [Streptococcus oralis]
MVKTLFHKKLKHSEITIKTTTWKEKLEILVGLALLALIIWYFMR